MNGMPFISNVAKISLTRTSSTALLRNSWSGRSHHYKVCRSSTTSGASPKVGCGRSCHSIRGRSRGAQETCLTSSRPPFVLAFPRDNPNSNAPTEIRGSRHWTKHVSTADAMACASAGRCHVGLRIGLHRRRQLSSRAGLSSRIHLEPRGAQKEHAVFLLVQV